MRPEEMPYKSALWARIKYLIDESPESIAVTLIGVALVGMFAYFVVSNLLWRPH